MMAKKKIDLFKKKVNKGDENLKKKYIGQIFFHPLKKLDGFFYMFFLSPELFKKSVTIHARAGQKKTCCCAALI